MQQVTLKKTKSGTQVLLDKTVICNIKKSSPDSTNYTLELDYISYNDRFEASTPDEFMFELIVAEGQTPSVIAKWNVD